MVLSNQTCPLILPAVNTKILEMVALGVIGPVSLIGNILVIAVISRSNRVQWVTNLFVAHLAVVNLSVPFLSVPFYFYWSLKRSWLLGNVSCKLVYFAHHLDAGVSVCMLACIALDRYYVVVHPLTLHLRRSQTFQLIMFIWIFIIFISTPILYFYEVQVTTCGSVCIVNNNLSTWGWFFLVFSLSAFFLPLCILVFLYAIVIKTVLQRDINSKAQSFQSVQQRSATDGSKGQQNFLGKVPKTKRKVIRMLIIQDLIFMACWLPYFANEFSKTWSPTNYNRNAIYLWLCFSNATINPMIYSVFNGNFRKGCRHLVNINISHPYTLKTLQRRHQIGINDSSHRASEDGGNEKYGIALRKSRRTSLLFARETNSRQHQTEARTDNNLEEDQKHFVKMFQASSAASVDAWT